MSRTLQGLALAFAVGLLVAGAWADDRDDNKKDRGKKGPLDDKTFVTKAAGGNRHEIKMGEIGSKRATATEVKEFAQKMVKDHTKSLDELTRAARAAGLDVSDKPTKEHEEMEARFDKLEKDFDAAFMKQMVTDHEKTLKLYEQASKDAKNDELLKYAEKTTPVVRDHLKMARKLSDARDGRKGSDKGSDKGKGGDKDRPAREKPFKDR